MGFFFFQAAQTDGWRICSHAIQRCRHLLLPGWTRWAPAQRSWPTQIEQSDTVDGVFYPPGKLDISVAVQVWFLWSRRAPKRRRPPARTTSFKTCLRVGVWTSCAGKGQISTTGHGPIVRGGVNVPFLHFFSSPLFFILCFSVATLLNSTSLQVNVLFSHVLTTSCLVLSADKVVWGWGLSFHWTSCWEIQFCFPWMSMN